MLTGFEKIIEERILKAQRQGEFDNLPGHGKPLRMEEGCSLPDDLRMGYKILKNADCLPPEIELKKEIWQTEELLTGMADTKEKYQTLKRLNYLIMKLNTLRNTSIHFEMPQVYLGKLTDRFGEKRTSGR